MKVLIGYDGSDCSQAALADLIFAGLPDDTEAVVMSVSEVWLPPEAVEETDKEVMNPYLEGLTEKYRQKGRKAVAEGEKIVQKAGERLKKMFPGWKVQQKATFGSPAWEIIAEGGEIKADLIVVGSHGRSAVGRFFLGSVSQKILTEALCSVRVARRGDQSGDPNRPRKIIIGFDGSKGANAAVEAVASRDWGQEGYEVRLITADNQNVISTVGDLVPPVAGWLEDEIEYERELMEKHTQPALNILKNAGFLATHDLIWGNPKQVLVEEAERWHADTIFIGANRFGSRVERFLLGSVSAAVAARAACSVEVVRK